MNASEITFVDHLTMVNGAQLVGIITKMEPTEIFVENVLGIVPGQGFMKLDFANLSIRFPSNIVHYHIEDAEHPLLIGYKQAMFEIHSGLVLPGINSIPKGRRHGDN